RGARAFAFQGLTRDGGWGQLDGGRRWRGQLGGALRAGLPRWPVSLAEHVTQPIQRLLTRHADLATHEEEERNGDERDEHAYRDRDCHKNPPCRTPRSM